MDKKDVLVMTVIIVGVSVPVVLISLLANGTIKFIPGQWVSRKRKCCRLSNGN